MGGTTLNRKKHQFCGFFFFLKNNLILLTNKSMVSTSTLSPILIYTQSHTPINCKWNRLAIKKHKVYLIKYYNFQKQT